MLVLVIGPVRHIAAGIRVGVGPVPDARERRRNELAEQRRWALWAGLELGMELGGDEERMILDSIVSTSRSSGEVPDTTSPAGAPTPEGLVNRLRSRLLTS